MLLREVCTILMAFALSQQALAQNHQAEAAAGAVAEPVPAENRNHEMGFETLEGDTAPEPAPEPVPANAAKWIAPKVKAGPRKREAWEPVPAEQAKEINERAKTPAQVRIGLRLTPFSKVVTRGAGNVQSTRYVPIEPLRHTLRARLNKINHFFVGDYHVETQPMKWVRKSRRYEVRLNVYRRFGAFGQLEENVGSVDLSGVLDEQEKGIHTLLGVARKRLRDKFGNPALDVVAGFSPGAARQGPTIGQGRTTREAPSNAKGALIRGRF